MTKKIPVFMGVAASALLVAELLANPSVVLGLVLVVALIVSLIITVHFLYSGSS